MEYKDTERRELDEKRFRIDTTVNVAHILTTVAMITIVMVFGFDMKAMVLKHESDIADIKQSRRDTQALLRDELQELNRKVDRIAERVGAGN